MDRNENEAGPSTKRLKASPTFQGACLKVFVLEGTEERVGLEGKPYGITNVLSKSTKYDLLHELSMPSKWIMKIKTSTNKFLLLKGYAIKEDGGIRLSDYSMVFDTTSEVIETQKKEKYLNPPITPIAVLKTLDKGSRVSITGHVERITQILQGKSSQRRIITLKDHTGEVDLKLWGQRLMTIEPSQGARITATALTVDHYMSRTNVNSNMSTHVQIHENVENINGNIQAACFQEDSLSIVIDETIFTLTSELMATIFPLLAFEENVSIRAEIQGNKIKTIIQVDRQDIEED